MRSSGCRSPRRSSGRSSDHRPSVPPSPAMKIAGSILVKSIDFYMLTRRARVDLIMVAHLVVSVAITYVFPLPWRPRFRTSIAIYVPPRRCARETRSLTLEVSAMAATRSTAMAIYSSSSRGDVRHRTYIKLVKFTT
jgi:hypothetical protein